MAAGGDHASVRRHLTKDSRAPCAAVARGGFAGQKGHSSIKNEAAQRRAAVRRYKTYSVALYACQAPERSNQCAWGSQIAVPRGRPGDARRAGALDSALLKVGTALQAVIGYLFSSGKHQLFLGGLDLHGYAPNCGFPLFVSAQSLQPQAKNATVQGQGNVSCAVSYGPRRSGKRRRICSEHLIAAVCAKSHMLWRSWAVRFCSGFLPCG